MNEILLLLILASSTGSYADGMLPEDVEQFASKREECDHFRGELPEPSQKARMRDVQRELRRLCTGTDNKQLAKLKKKYATEPQIMATLNEFEQEIESSKLEGR